MSGETSIFHCQVVIYSLDSEKHQWMGRGQENWADMYFFMESQEDQYYFRMVAWIQSNGEVVLNNALTKQGCWVIVADDFLQFTDDEHNESVGICFVDQYQACQVIEALNKIFILLGASTLPIPDYGKAYIELFDHLEKLDLLRHLPALQQHGVLSVKSLIKLKESDFEQLKLSKEEQRRIWESCSIESKLAEQTSEDDTEEEEVDQYNLESLSLVSMPNLPKPPPRGSASSSNRGSVTSNGSRRVSLAEFGAVEQAALQATAHEHCECSFLKANFGSYQVAGNNVNGENDSRESISLPFQTTQELHVTYNMEQARYEGLPPAWNSMNQQFGVPLVAVPKRKVKGYSERIPAVLEMLKDYLIKHDGLLVEGIFRLAPDKEACAQAKAAINSGVFEGCSDMNIIANLIKVWFRELPNSLFTVIPEKEFYRISRLTDVDEIIGAMNSFSEPHKSIILWLLDLMGLVVQNEKVNKMSAKNMAIVLAPNLYSIDSVNPMVALTMSQTIADFTLTLLTARMTTYEIN